MKPIKYITFLIKDERDFCSRRITSYNYTKQYPKFTVLSRKVHCTYQKLIAKRYRIHDMISYIKSDPRFPLNKVEYMKLMVEIEDDAQRLMHTLSNTFITDYQLNILSYLFTSLHENTEIIQNLLHNELNDNHPVTTKSIAYILKNNLNRCVNILREYNQTTHLANPGNVVSDLETYLCDLKTLCGFMFLVILKKSSYTVYRILPVIPLNRVSYCSFCQQEKTHCQCFEYNESYRYRQTSSSSFPYLDEDILNRPHSSHQDPYTIALENNSQTVGNSYSDNYRFENYSHLIYSPRDSSSDTD